MTAIGGVAQLGEAVLTGRAVGTDERERLTGGVGIDDREATARLEIELADVDRIDVREWRRERGQIGDQLIDGDARALRLDEDAARVVAHEAVEGELARTAQHEWPEADTLHDAGHANRRAPVRVRPAAQAHRAHAPTIPTSAWSTVACASWMRGMCSLRVTIT